MPTLVRLLTVLAFAAAAVFAGMAALVYLVEPTPRRIVVDVPLNLPVPGTGVAAGGGSLQP
ncbi:histidine kinase [Aureimonas leprariae]|uniref:Histidine kinase n=1 Tax=Plantimonas leprariae TaxID=2615207 RepID=A0A7V7TV22_9HYPH|nr:histidine kinase [Aureimonas leprariae]KAB0677053.1 histidine kinase [Aureimonas leprariae]